MGAQGVDPKAWPAIGRSHSILIRASGSAATTSRFDFLRRILTGPYQTLFNLVIQNAAALDHSVAPALFLMRKTKATGSS